MTLSNLLISKKTRENAGSRTDERFNYQKDLSLYTMMEYHRKDGNYVFLFDFHDDLAVIDSDINPNAIKFYQIKTKSKGNWTVTNLTKVDKGENSYLGKLYSNKINFDNYVSELCFITNSRYNISMSSGELSESKYEIVAKDIEKSSISIINDKLKKEFDLSYTPSFEDITTFKVSKLSLVDSQTHCKGALNEILEYTNPGKTPNVTLMYNKIFNEIRIKTDCVIEEYNVLDINELISKKGISKKEFALFLQEANNYKSSGEEWQEIEQKLIACEVGYINIRILKNKFRELNILLLNSPNDTPLLSTISYISDKINYLCYTEHDDTNIHTLNYYRLMEKTFEVCVTDLPYKHFDDLLIKSIILKELNNE